MKLKSAAKLSPEAILPDDGACPLSIDRGVRHMATTKMSHSRPLCVDCDGTLIRTDLLHESALVLFKREPWALLLLFVWLFRGKAYVKARIAERAGLDWSLLPLRAAVVESITQARRDGRLVVLATAAHEKLAASLAAHLKCFDDVLATREGLNLSGKVKAEALTARFGRHGFDYIGDSGADLPVWAEAHTAVVVDRSGELSSRARKVASRVETIDARVSTFRTLMRAMRPHQWAKNLLVFVPLVAAHALTSPTGIWGALLAFASFSLCASSVYLINDLFDLESDRRHARKRKRPFASGDLQVAVGIVAAPVALTLSFVLALYLPSEYWLVLGLYFVLTMAYSLRLKRQVVVDVIMLAGLYTLRIVAGAVATAIVPSFWLLAFSMFLFLSLALVKRYTELRQQESARELAIAGRGYRVSDLPVLLAMGSASGMVAVLVFALFINAPSTVATYGNIMWLWLIPPVLLYWSTRIWMKAHRDELDDDPVVFALRDWHSLVALALCATLFWAAR